MFQGPPQPFNHALVAPCVFSVHTDLSLYVGQNVNPRAVDKVTGLIAVEGVSCG